MMSGYRCGLTAAAGSRPVARLERILPKSSHIRVFLIGGLEKMLKKLGFTLEKKQFCGRLIFIDPELKNDDQR